MTFAGFVFTGIRLAAGALGAQMVGFATAGLLGRSFIPGPVGSYLVCYTTASIVAFVSTGGLEYPLISERRARTAAVLRILSIRMSGITSVALSTAAAWPFLSGQMPFVPKEAHWVLAAILVFPLGVHQALSAVANRHSRFADLARNRFVLTFANLGAILAGTWFAHSAEMLLIATILAYVCAISHLHWVLRPYSGPTRRIEFYYMAVVVRRFWKSTVVGVPARVANAIIYSAPLYFLNSRHNPEITGSFALVQKMIAAPINVLTGAANGAIRHGSAQHPPAGIAEEFGRAAHLLIPTAAILAMAGLIIGPASVTALLGPKWPAAAAYSVFLIPMYLVRLVEMPLAQIAARQLSLTYRTVYLGCWTAVILATLWVCRASASDVMMVAVYSAVNSFIVLTNILMCWRTCTHGNMPAGHSSGELRQLS